MKNQRSPQEAIPSSAQRKLPEAIHEKLLALQKKYEAMGQDMGSYLEGLLHADYLTYWNYVELDALHSLQHPRTSFKDEMIFIVYHQITELYFKLIMHELEQICAPEQTSARFFTDRMVRINRYFENLVSSYDIMVDGMEPDQFLKFRMSLLPASGFQSASFRAIEIYATPLKNLVHYSERGGLKGNERAEQLYELLYWKRGAVELATKKKTLTLRQFEAKYSDYFLGLARRLASYNLLEKFHWLEKSRQSTPELKRELRYFDILCNVNWKLSHFRSAARYLHSDEKTIKATGGTNWQNFLPPMNQMIRFFPDLWSKKEIENWGKKFLKREDL